MQNHLPEAYFPSGHPCDERWLLYLDGALDPATSRRMRRHTEICPDCGQFFFSLTAVRATLREQAARLRDAVRISDEELQAMLDHCLGELWTESNLLGGTRPRWTPREAMLMLRLLVEPICGSGTAGATIRLAVRRSTAGLGGRVTERNWSLFVSNLSDAMASVCGSAAGRLVSRAGVSLGIREG